MEKVKLPESVVDVAACAELGARLRAGTVELDWSGVKSADDGALAKLLEGVALDAMPDGLGADSVPESLMDRIVASLRGNDENTIAAKKKAKAATKKSAKAKGSSAVEAPAIWRAPESRKFPSDRPKKPRDPKTALVLPAEIPSAAALREKLVDLVQADLLGPAGGETEIMSEGRLRPRDRYVVGVLAPRRLRVQREIEESLGAGAEDSEDGGDDDSGLSGDTMFPSTIGMSFCVAVGTKVVLTARWGRYERTKSEDAEEPTSGWQRHPQGGTLPPMLLKEGSFGPLKPDASDPDVTVRGVVSPLGSQLVVSVFLVNGKDEPETKRDEVWLFQTELSAAGEDGAPIFVGRRDDDGRLGDALPQADDASLKMLYRKRLEFAVGHGVSVEVTPDPTDPARARQVRTRAIPRHELAQQLPRVPAPEGLTRPLFQDEDPALQGLVLDMKVLGESEEPAALLAKLPEVYATWIREREKQVAEDPSLRGHKIAAEENLELCRAALARIEGGLALLRKDSKAREAFRFANRAMWAQRVHTELAESRRRGESKTLEDIDRPAARSWRTFQLAFVLLTLEGITDLSHPDRSEETSAVADLLWFPTGGGKTEAYLGCTAYVLGLRRLQGEIEGRSGEHGVAVIMRYTLRLLTIQQFQRATALICACERIRLEAANAGDRRWGAEPFRIGLWVGAKTTPNKTEHAAEALKQKRGATGYYQGAHASMGSPAQLKTCPWCGTNIDEARHVRVDGSIGRTFTFCGDDRGVCPFSERNAPTEGIPVLVVDEEIYRKLPALLVSTVDKFAQMPWNGQVQMLFGQVNGRCTRHGFRSPDTDDASMHPKRGTTPAAKTVETALLRPPDLIIQDELHLISGPLGTLTGLYETAVDELSTWEVAGRRVRPKVIASTATVRRAEQQMRALFARTVQVFPPPGLDTEDNFFSVQRDVASAPGRLYLGVCAPGKRLKSTMIRVYVALLQATEQLYRVYGRHVDPWMTLVGYFGSLRELAGTRRLVDDDIKQRLYSKWRQGLPERRLGAPKELTSRLGATEIPGLLDHLELPFDERTDDRWNERAEDYRQRPKKPIDVLLATNMISVGVDVKRLGLMVCSGQPKNTSEYIQATSRVGRQKPGLVVTIYNWARPRDQSHYETFAHYHATFYQHVEALSVTPFASRALDRGLTALLVSLIRLRSDEMNSNESAAEIDLTSDVVKQAVDAILKRAGRVAEDQGVGETIKRTLEARLQDWANRAKPGSGAGRLVYKEKKGGDTTALLAMAGAEKWEAFTCLGSLRDVEATVSLLLDEGGLGEEPKEAVVS